MHKKARDFRKLRRNKLTAFATWTEKEEAMFLNPETDDYNIYLEDEDRQLPAPFNTLDIYDGSSYVKVHVPLPLEVQTVMVFPCKLKQYFLKLQVTSLCIFHQVSH